MAQNVEYIISLRDKFSGKLSGINASMQKLGSRMKQTGAILSVALTAPIGILAGVAIKSFDTQVKAENKLRAALKANGEEVEKVFADYKQFASQLQEVTIIGDESTLKLLQVAQSMGLTGESAKTAAKEAIAMSGAMGINEQSAIRYTAALAQGDATMLKRYLPSLRDITDQAEGAAEAHRLLATMFGTVTAEAQGGLGPIIQLKNQWGDFLEQIGEIITKGLLPIVNRLKGVVKWLQNLSPATKKTIVIIGGLVAALGPLLIALGFLMTTVIPGLITAFAALSAVIAANPIGILVTVIGLAVAGFLLFRKSGEKITKMQEKLNKITKKFSNLLVEEKSKASLLFKQLKTTNKGTAERSRLIKEINSKYGKFLKNHITEKFSLQDISKAQNEVIDGIKRRIAAKTVEAKQTEIIQSQFEREEKFLSTLNKLREKQFITLLRGPITDIEKLIEGFNEIGGASQDAFNMVNSAIEVAKIADKANLIALRQLAIERKRDAALIEKMSERAKLLVGGFGDEITAGLKEGMEAAGITKVVSAAPKIFNITIDNLVETINNNVTNLKEGMNESKKIITEALLTALSDVQVNVR